MKYEELTPEQKRAYGFIKLTKREIRFITQTKTGKKRIGPSRLIEKHRPQLRLIVNEG